MHPTGSQEELLTEAVLDDEAPSPTGPQQKGLRVFTATVFAVGSLAGVGVLALPGSMIGIGYLGILFNVLSAAISAYTAVLLGRCWVMVSTGESKDQQKIRSPYIAIGQACFSQKGRWLVTVVQNMELFGAAVVVLLLASGNMQSLLRNLAGLNMSLCYWLVVVAYGLCPVVWQGTPKDFWPVAVGAVVATSVACVIILVNIVKDEVNHVTPVTVTYADINPMDFFTSLGTIYFAYGGHSLLPTIQTDMRRPAMFGRAITSAYLIIFTLYVPLAVVAYTVYGDGITANVLDTMSAGPMRYCVQILNTLQLFATFTFALNPMCQCVEARFSIPTQCNFRRVVFRSVMVSLVLFVAESVPNFGPILSLIGGSTVTMIGYILPPLFYMRLCSMAHLNIPLVTKVTCAAIMSFAITAGCAVTVSAIRKLTHFASMPCYIKTGNYSHVAGHY